MGDDSWMIGVEARINSEEDIPSRTVLCGAPSQKKVRRRTVSMYVIAEDPSKP